MKKEKKLECEKCPKRKLCTLTRKIIELTNRSAVYDKEELNLQRALNKRIFNPEKAHIISENIQIVKNKNKRLKIKIEKMEGILFDELRKSVKLSLDLSRVRTIFFIP